MYIDSVFISGFRCFDHTGQRIALNDMTCFVGPNASGKTAAMMALTRMFGDSASQRQITPSDFHLAAGEVLKAKSVRVLVIECRLAFPELENSDTSKLEKIAEVFNQMIVDEPNGTPYCRIRLEAKWIDDGTTIGETEQRLFWICTDSDEPEELETHKHPVTPGNRSRIRVIYVPAARDPEYQIRTSATTSFGRLLDALVLETTEATLRTTIAQLQDDITGLAGIKTMNQHVQDAWDRFYAGRVARQIAFRALEEEPSALVRLLVPTFKPGEDGRTMFTADLGDGLRSLFSFSLSLGLYQVEKTLQAQASDAGFKAEITDKLPTLTVFAVEEPENHLSPQYLGRVTGELITVAKDDRAQVVISSHSPSILGRVEPDDVRYFLGHEHTQATTIKPIPLPQDESDESFKFVREAVRGYPELYFARLVILAEGPSEEIVLRRLFKASGAPLDANFIAIVPLGGRHVNHFWRLLHGLGIPYLTLLDLDREKEGAGWGRIQYVRNQLVELYGRGSTRLQFNVFGTSWQRSLDEECFDHMLEWEPHKPARLQNWVNYLERHYDIYFSSPLDLDFSMLEAFPTEYKALVHYPRGPHIPDVESPNYWDFIDRRVKQVLASDLDNAPANLGATFSSSQRELFPWYKYLFVDGSKPVTHMRLLSTIDDKTLVSRAPRVLKALITRACALVPDLL